MTLKQKSKNLLSNLLRFGLSGALLVYLYNTIDVDKTWNAVKSADGGFIALAFLVFMVINYILLMRWNIFINALGLRAPFLSIARYFFVGLFGNLFLPSAIGGDIIKTIGLCQVSHSEKPKVVASALLDRLSGFAAIALVAVISFFVGYVLKVIEDRSLLVGIVMIAGGSVSIGVVLFNEKIYSFCCKIFQIFPKFQKALMQMHYDIALLRERKDAIYKAIGVSCFSQLCMATTFFLTAKALHQDVPLLYCIIFTPLICVASCVPSIGGLGVREAAAAFLFVRVGVDSGVAVSIVFIGSSVFMMLVGLLGGAFYMLTKNPEEEAAIKKALKAEQGT
ncbi:MAG: flippase-like domain-containing protein [Candidatus Omnitrophica bacterium]|nr:flippase-like domain-containing protein [Candidatus Omnitrophota bacterium]